MTAILDFHHVTLVLNRFKINQKQTKLAKIFQFIKWTGKKEGAKIKKVRLDRDREVKMSVPLVY